VTHSVLEVYWEQSILFLHHVVMNYIYPVNNYNILNGYINTKSPSFKVEWSLPLAIMILVTIMASDLSSTWSFPTWKLGVCSPRLHTHWLKYWTLLNSSSIVVSSFWTCTPICLRPTTTFQVFLVISIWTPFRINLSTPMLNLRSA